MRKVKAAFHATCPARVHRIIGFDDLAGEWKPELHFMVPARTCAEVARIDDLRRGGLGNISWTQGDDFEDGDVLVPNAQRGEAVVLLRESDEHHALFMTNRCNSYCLMCSQPPTTGDDSWLIAEAIDAIRHLRRAPALLGLTGGEPLLLGGGLRRILDAIGRYHPETGVEVLTNGRLLAEASFVSELLDGLTTPVRWLVPLYGHADLVHDFVVQAPGAFDQTLAGLLALQARSQSIQLRIVLVRPVLEILPELVSFIGRNLPFVREVALMACEPIGFALANRELCEVDLAEWSSTLEHAARQLRRSAIPHLFMNAPLCALPKSLWPAAHRSISDWKNVYADECQGCAVKEKCSGLFAWHGKGWKPARLAPVKRDDCIQ